MKLLRINIGKERTQQRKDYVETTGIYKMPVNEPVEITSLGIDGDAICDKKHHGGPDQALYIYGGADYAWWSNEIGKELGPGTFGDNLTISDLESATFNVGDYLHVGEVTLQVTSPRIPSGGTLRTMVVATAGRPAVRTPSWRRRYLSNFGKNWESRKCSRNFFRDGSLDLM